MSNNWSGAPATCGAGCTATTRVSSQADENGRTSPNVGRLYDYPIMMFDGTGQAAYGTLATDRTHQLKVQVIYDFKFGLSAGLNWFGASGSRARARSGFIPPNNFPVNYLGRNSDGRLPFYNQADLYAQYRLKLGDRQAPDLQRQRDQPVRPVDRDELLPDRELRQRRQRRPGRVLPRPAQLPDAGAAAGRVTDARFMKDSGFQGVRSIRLGMKFSF